jgi:hypothetical protein
VSAEGVRGAEDGIYKRSLAVVDVRDNGKVPDFINRGHVISNEERKAKNKNETTDYTDFTDYFFLEP